MIETLQSCLECLEETSYQEATRTNVLSDEEEFFDFDRMTIKTVRYPGSKRNAIEVAVKDATGNEKQMLAN